jgi:SecD/SecF fusion protein
MLHFGDLPEVVTYGKQNQVKITTKYKINENGAEDEVDTKLYEGLKSFLPAGVTKEVFLSDKYRQVLRQLVLLLLPI